MENELPDSSLTVKVPLLEIAKLWVRLRPSGLPSKSSDGICKEICQELLVVRGRETDFEAGQEMVEVEFHVF